MVLERIAPFRRLRQSEVLGCTAPGTLSASSPVALHRATTHESLDQTGKKGWRGWELKIASGGAKPQQLRHMRRTTNVSLHTLHVLHDKFDTQRATQNGATDRPSFWSGMKAHRAGSVVFARAALRRQPLTPPSSPAASPSAASFTAKSRSLTAVASVCGLARPTRRKSGEPRKPQAVARGVFSVALGEGPLASDVVDERQPSLWKPSGQRHKREHLCQDLQHVDKGLASPPKRSRKSGRCRPAVLEDAGANPDDVAPSVLAAGAGLDGQSRPAAEVRPHLRRQPRPPAKHRLPSRCRPTSRTWQHREI